MNKQKDNYHDYDVHLNVKVLHDNVVETLFCALPVEKKEREKEQKRRQKFKEKLLQSHQNKLIIDSSYVDNDGKAHQQYTNAIFVSEKIESWKDRIDQALGQDYSQKIKAISGGHQLLYRDSDGNKYLTFSFYPTKNKMMVQGNHEEICQFINLFTEISGTINDGSQCEDQEESDLDDENDVTIIPSNVSATIQELEGDSDNKIDSEEKDTHDANENSELNASANTDTPGTDSMLLATGPDISNNLPFSPVEDLSASEDDPGWLDILPATQAGNLPTQKGSRSHRRSSRRLSYGIQRDAPQLLHIKKRLDTLDAVLAGLQGGVLNLVDRMEEYKKHSEAGISKIVENTSKLLEKLSDAKKGSPATHTHAGSSKDFNQIKETIVQVQREVSKKVNVLSEQMKSAIASSESQCQKIISTIKEDESCQAAVSEVIHSSSERMSDCIGHMERRVTDAIAKHDGAVKRVIDTLKGEQGGSRVRARSPTLPADSVTGFTDKRTAEQRQLLENKESRSQFSRPKHTEQINARAKESDSLKQDRTTLLVGDSVTKLIDKRRLLKNQTVSKCRAGTISEAFYKIQNGGTHEMKNIIFCVGLNDIRNNTNTDQIVDDMKCVLEETQHKHPHCNVYVCSILPVDTKKVPKQLIDCVNSHFQHFEKYMDNVFYIDLLSAFLSNQPLSDLFDDDRIHPNQKGTVLLMNTIRNSLEHVRRPLRQFVSKRANTTQKSYAECVSTPPVHLPPENDGRAAAGFTSMRGLPINGPQTFAGNPWWPPGYYPPMFPAPAAGLFPQASGKGQCHTVW